MDFDRFTQLRNKIREEALVNGINVYKRENIIAGIVESEELNPAMIGILISDAFYAGKETGKAELKKEIARL
jgi:hypothetical protein